MPTTALLTIDEQDGNTTSRPRHFGSTSSDPLFLVPAVADWYAHASLGTGALTVEDYRRFAAGHPHLPSRELTGTELTARPDRAEHRYHLTLAANSPGLQLSIETDADPAVRALTHGDLYAVAADCAEAIAERAHGFADSHEGIHLPGADPRWWGHRARRFRRLHQLTATRAAGANLAAVFHPPTFDDAHPAVQVAGVMVFAYLDADGIVRVSVDLDETEPWLLRGLHQLVPIEISINGIGVYTAYTLS